MHYPVPTINLGVLMTPLNSPTLSPKKSSHLLKEHAYTQIKKSILNGSLPPLTLLSERQIAQSLGMSKTPIQSAISRLEMEGFITISPQQGIFVRDLRVDEIADQYEIRLALESFILKNLAGKLTPPQAQKVEANLAEQERNLKTRDVELAVNLDADFHALFCEFLGNREIIRTLENLRDKIRRVISRVFQSNPDRLLQSFKEHCHIFDATREGNAAKVKKAIQDHLELGKRVLLDPRS